MADVLALQVDRFATPLGEGVVVSDDEGALRLFYWDDPLHRWEAALKQRYRNFTLRGRRANAFGHVKAFKDYFDGDVFGIDALPVAFGGTPFQMKVWNALRKIPRARRRPMAHWRRRSTCRPRCARSGSPMARTR